MQVPQKLKIPEESIDISLSSSFLDITLQAKGTIAKINKWDYIKLESSCTTKETMRKVKRPLIEWEKIFANGI